MAGALPRYEPAAFRRGESRLARQQQFTLAPVSAAADSSCLKGAHHLVSTFENCHSEPLHVVEGLALDHLLGSEVLRPPGCELDDPASFPYRIGHPAFCGVQCARS